MQPAGRKTIAILLFFDRPVEYKTRHNASHLTSKKMDALVGRVSTFHILQTSE
jgi:hypothetical protein